MLLRNTGQRDIWISSHFPLDQVNPAVEIRFAGDAKNGPFHIRMLTDGDRGRRRDGRRPGNRLPP